MKTVDELIEQTAPIVRRMGLNPDKPEDWKRAIQEDE